ncbi:unnamed protein product, partial [Ectocarpus sp. 13 AM-2016]
MFEGKERRKELIRDWRTTASRRGRCRPRPSRPDGTGCARPPSTTWPAKPSARSSPPWPTELWASTSMARAPVPVLLSTHNIRTVTG